jgi:hypothetical protein
LLEPHTGVIWNYGEEKSQKWNSRTQDVIWYLEAANQLICSPVENETEQIDEPIGKKI